MGGRGDPRIMGNNRGAARHDEVGNPSPPKKGVLLHHTLSCPRFSGYQNMFPMPTGPNRYQCHHVFVCTAHFLQTGDGPKNPPCLGTTVIGQVPLMCGVLHHCCVVYCNL